MLDELVTLASDHKNILIKGFILGVIIPLTILYGNRIYNALHASFIKSSSAEEFFKQTKGFCAEVPDIFKFLFITLPKIILVVSLIIAVLVVPFMLAGPVGGMVILTCIVLIFSNL